MSEEPHDPIFGIVELKDAQGRKYELVVDKYGDSRLYYGGVIVITDKPIPLFLNDVPVRVEPHPDGKCVLLSPHNGRLGLLFDYTGKPSLVDRMLWATIMESFRVPIINITGKEDRTSVGVEGFLVELVIGPELTSIDDKIVVTEHNGFPARGTNYDWVLI